MLEGEFSSALDKEAAMKGFYLSQWRIGPIVESSKERPPKSGVRRHEENGDQSVYQRVRRIA